MDHSTQVKYARGLEPSELVLKNVWLVNVFTGEIYKSDVAINDGIIVGVGDYEGLSEKDMTGKYLIPGLIDGHIIVESSMLSLHQFNKAVLPLGTTTIVADVHEIANILGAEGVNYMIEAAQHIPLDVFLTAASSVPASPYEMAGASFDLDDIERLLKNDKVVGLGEIMDYPGILAGKKELWDKINLSKSYHKVIDGHAPGLKGKDLAAYIMAGIRSDHECTTVEEAAERIRLGQYVMIREGAASKNLDRLYPLITPGKSRRIILIGGDRHPEELTEKGHMDYAIRRLIKKGVNPVTAVQMATLNTAEYFHMRDRGAIAPGYLADLVLLDDLKEFRIAQVYKKGQLVASGGEVHMTGSEIPIKKVRKTFAMPKLSPDNLVIPYQGPKARVIGIVPNQVLTQTLLFDIESTDGKIGGDIDQDVIKIAVAERHKNTGKVGVGLVHGFGLREGAIATSIANDAHNLTVIGANDPDICLAANTIRKMQGGICIVKDGEVLISLSLPIAGIMSSDDLTSVNRTLKDMKKKAMSMGVRSDVDPFMTLAFMTLSVVPELKITPLGLYQVDKQKLVEVSY